LETSAQVIERFLIVMTVLVLGWVLFDRPDPPERSVPVDVACADRSTAWSMARVIVRQNLGRPLSARFPDRWTSDLAEGVKFRYLGNCRHRITAFVDVFYRYNEPTRRYFVIELSYHGQTGWRVDRLFVNEAPSS
jgi:hypothetical protein